MYQFYDINKEKLSNAVELPEYLANIIYDADKQLGGLVGVDLDSGLVEVVLGKDKQTGKVKRTKMKFGKYLIKVGMGEDFAREKSSELRAAVASIKGAKLEFARTAEEIEWVYSEGPNSCMSGTSCVRVYESEDVAIAFVKISDRVVARTVVCVNHELGLGYTEVYGNSDLLRPLLEQEGFDQHTEALDGCRLSKVEEWDKLVLPYLDGCMEVDDMGDYLQICSNGEYSANNTDGYAGATCEECGGRVKHADEDLRHAEWPCMSLCQDCYSDRHVRVNGEEYDIESPDVSQDSEGNWVLSSELEEDEQVEADSDEEGSNMRAVSYHNSQPMPISRDTIEDVPFTIGTFTAQPSQDRIAEDRLYRQIHVNVQEQIRSIRLDFELSSVKQLDFGRPDLTMQEEVSLPTLL